MQNRKDKVPEFEPSPALTRVARGNLCAGCGACAGLAPDAVAMHRDGPGYLRPLQTGPLHADQEATLTAICPALGQQVQASEDQTGTVLWGPYRTVATGWASDPAVRHAASSGGALSALLGAVLKTGRVDEIVQVAADPDDPLSNVIVRTSAPDDIMAAAGSRYAPSAPLEGMQDILAEHRETGRRFAFVGKPCDVAALRAWTRQSPEVAAAFPVAFSFFCAGVPSRTGGLELLQALGVTADATQSFRYRGYGWPGQATATLHDGSQRSMGYNESWGAILSHHVQMRCKICADGTGTAADIVCADAWESDERGYPVFDERPGVSLILERTTLGGEILAEAVAGGDLVIADTPFDIRDLADIQPGQRTRRRALLARLVGRRLAGRPIPAYRGLQILAASRENSLRQNLKNALGMLRRTFKERST